MSMRETIDFVQTHFGDNRGIPNLPNGRPRLPEWLEGRIEEAAPIEEKDRTVIEGTIDEPAAPSEATSGTSVEELFAYYLPFHFYKTGWGIYIRAYGIERLARLLTTRTPITVSSVLFAVRLLLEHERLHFFAELAASRTELAFGKPSYSPYFRNSLAATHEEALANAQAFSSGTRGVSASMIQATYSWMSKQGMGYRDFHQWLGPHLAKGKRKAAAFMVDQTRSAPRGAEVSLRVKRPRAMKRGQSEVLRRRSTLPNGPVEFLFPVPSRLHPPTYLIVDVPVPWLRVARPFPKLSGLQVFVHTNDHKPPHIHISVLGRKDETRYHWPDLRPLPADPVLSRSDEKSLRAYVQRYGKEIEAKVKSVPWT